MSAYRAAAFWVAIIIITMLTLNIKIEKNSDKHEEHGGELLRKKRAVGTKPVHVLGVCGGSSYGRNGWLAPPNFPGSSYPAHSSCNWTIIVFPRLVIQFDFVYMDLEDAPVQKRGGCTSDYIEIRESQNENEPLVGGQRYCGFDTTFNSVYTKSNRAYVYFKSDHSKEYQGFAIRWRAVEPPKPQFDCDFESVKDLCIGWEQSTDDDFDWTAHNGPTQSGKSSATGPTTDRTKKDEFGVYLYTEASGIKKGEKAILLSPYVRVPGKRGRCFRFWYHMRGETMGTLNVYKNEIFSEKNSTKQLVFSKSGEQSKVWKRADINVTASENKIQFIFEGIRGSSYKSDMAIDDIQLLKKPCPAPRIFTRTTKAPIRPTRPIFARTRPPTPSTRRVTRRPTTTRRSRPTTNPFTTTTQANCFHNCKEVGNCVLKEYFCDGIPDCLHREDENDCSATQAVASSPAPKTSEWDDWTSWSSCSATCGGGRSERERKCIRGGPFDCIGSSSEGIECNTQRCLHWNDWQAWSECSLTCGEGVRMRSRTCHGGQMGQPGCVGPYIEVDFCNEHNCPKWSDWALWSQCEATCGNGTKSRKRTCQGAQVGEPGCIGNATEIMSCTNPSLPSCGEWTEWTGFTECSRSCGVGRRMRSRQCRDNGVLTEGCPGSRTDEENCNTISCPEWSEWEPYSECSVTCGNGTKSRTRKCMQNGVESQSCSGDSRMEEDCSNEPCKEWAEWAPWSRCTSSCGTGFHGRRRLCMKGIVRSVGCSGKSIETGICNADPCPSWREWGNWQSCTRNCGGGKRERRRSCDGGAPNTGDCTGSDMEQEDCNDQSCPTQKPATTRPPPITPKRSTPRWGKWSQWNACSQPCGLGTQQRRRDCVGGRAGRRGCRGKVKDTQDCNEGPCTTATTTTSTIATKPRGWGIWTDWSSCSVSCGKGAETRTRECHGTKPGRKGCRGKKKDIKTCELSCPEPTPVTTEAKCFERNAAKAKKGGRKCPSKCATNKDCQRGKKCVCDGLCGKTCQLPSKQCSDIVSQQKKRGTKVACSAGNSVGSVCIFSCEKGFKLKGKSTVICQGTSKWTNEKNFPSCTASAVIPTMASPICEKKKSSHNACCGKRSYNSRSAKCCNEKVSPGGKAATKCCASKPYDPKKRGCCKNKLFWISRQKCKNGRVVKK